MVESEIETQQSLQGEVAPVKKKKRRWWRITLDVLIMSFFVISIAVSINVIVLSTSYDVPFFVNGMSMYPTLNADGQRYENGAYRRFRFNDGDAHWDSPTTRGDYVDFGYGRGGTTLEWRSSLKRGDVIITFYPSDATGYNPDGTPIIPEKTASKIKRIIGLPGETVVWEESAIDNEEQNRIWGKTTITPQNGEPFIYKPLLSVADYHIEDSPKPYDFPTGSRSWVLGEDEYIIMGDNRGYSSDSRKFGILKGAFITGKAELIAGTKRLGSDHRPIDTYWHYFAPWTYWRVK